MRTIIKGGRIATACDTFLGDICIDDGKIQEIGTNLKYKSDSIIDASGKIVIPGGVDAHTHLNLHIANAVSVDDFYSGTVAGACGGTTCIVDHMGFGPKGCSLSHQLKVYHEYASGSAVIDYSFHGVVQGVDEAILKEMEAMVIKEGIPSFKIYLTYDFKVSDEDSFKVMLRLKELGGITTVHAENDGIINFLRAKFKNGGKTSPTYHAFSRPSESEGEAVNRMINISEMAKNAPLYIVHLSTESGLSHIKRAIERGSHVYSETCPQYLMLNEDKYMETGCEGLKYIMSPPLRTRRDSEALWKGIKDGYINVIATDHCSFSYVKDKQKGKDDFTVCPGGIPGIEERIPAIFSEGVMKGRISINKFVEVCCTNPAKIFGLYPKKGTIAPGSDGDIVIIDPDREVTLTRGMLHSNSDYTAYEGLRLKGYPILTMSKGEIIARENEFIGTRGSGSFIKRNNNLSKNIFEEGAV